MCLKSSNRKEEKNHKQRNKLGMPRINFEKSEMINVLHFFPPQLYVIVYKDEINLNII